MTKLRSFFRQYAFEWLLLIFSVGIPFALDMGPAFYGILATFFIFLPSEGSATGHSLPYSFLY